MESVLKKYNAGLQFIMGIAAATLAVITPINFFVFAPVAAFVVFLSPRFLSLSGVSLVLIFIFSAIGVSSYLGNSSSNSLAVEMLVALFLLLSLSLTRCRAAFFDGFMSVFVIIAMINVLINIATWAYGADIFGRVLDYRPGDFLPRFNGLYGHAFASVSICIAGFFASLLLDRNKLAVTFICLLPFTGSIRASLITVFLLGLVFTSLFFRRRRVFFITYIILLASALISVVILIDAESNRFLAWGFGLKYFGDNWLFGYPGFANVAVDEGLGVTIDYLIANGNYESMLINMGAHFGLPAILVISAILLTSFHRALAEPRELAYVVFVGYLLFDILLGNFLNFIPTVIFSGIVLGRLSGLRSFRGAGL